MDSRLQGSSVHEILQEIILEWVAISFSRRFSGPRDKICISCVSLSLSLFKKKKKNIYIYIHTHTHIYIYIVVVLQDICLTIMCWFNMSMSQPQVYICSLPLESPSHLPPHSTPLDYHRALGCVPCVTQQIPTGYGM